MADKKSTPVKVEDSKALAPKSYVDVEGLRDVPTDIIPIPFYKLVQPGSTNVTLSDGEDALPGTFFMGDTGKAVPELRFAILRAKRQTREFTSKDGLPVKTTSIGVLGATLTDLSPFILTVSLASFSNFGRLMKQFKDKKVAVAWEYPVVATTEKREETKEIGGRMQKVKYWVVNFALEGEKLDKEANTILTDLYSEHGGGLDRGQEEPELDKEAAPF